MLDGEERVGKGKKVGTKWGRKSADAECSTRYEASSGFT